MVGAHALEVNLGDKREEGLDSHGPFDGEDAMTRRRTKSVSGLFFAPDLKASSLRGTSDAQSSVPGARLRDLAYSATCSSE